MTENSPLSFRRGHRVSILGGRHDGLVGTVVSGLMGSVEAENVIDGLYRYRLKLDGGLGFVLEPPRFLCHLPVAQQVGVAVGVAAAVDGGEMHLSDDSTEDVDGVLGTDSETSVDGAVEENVEVEAGEESAEDVVLDEADNVFDTASDTSVESAVETLGDGDPAAPHPTMDTFRMLFDVVVFWAVSLVPSDVLRAQVVLSQFSACYAQTVAVYPFDTGAAIPIGEYPRRFEFFSFFDLIAWGIAGLSEVDLAVLEDVLDRLHARVLDMRLRRNIASNLAVRR
jgi:hypothetical protein